MSIFGCAGWAEERGREKAIYITDIYKGRGERRTSQTTVSFPSRLSCSLSASARKNEERDKSTSLDASALRKNI